MDSEEKRRHRRSSGTVTLRDVAADAGVSMITVSRVLNKTEGVSDKVRAHVEESARKLGYIKNRHAGSLASVKTSIVTVIVPSLSGRVFAEIIRGADAVLRERGLQILVSNTFYSLQDEEEICRQLLGWSPQGMIVAGIDHHPDTRELLLRAEIPVVEAMELGEDSIDINIGLSHIDAGRTAAGHLLERGYVRPGFIGAEMARDFRAQRRRAGFLETLSERNIALAHERQYDEPAGFELGKRAVAEIIDYGIEVDALFCVNDELAIGAIGECLRRSVRVPQDLAVMGFNDLDVSSVIVPGLTTIRSPRLKMGELAARAILERIDGRPTASRIDVGFELVQRDST